MEYIQVRLHNTRYRFPPSGPGIATEIILCLLKLSLKKINKQINIFLFL